MIASTGKASPDSPMVEFLKENIVEAKWWKAKCHIKMGVYTEVPGLMDCATAVENVSLTMVANMRETFGKETFTVAEH